MNDIITIASAFILEGLCATAILRDWFKTDFLLVLFMLILHIVNGIIVAFLFDHIVFILASIGMSFAAIPAWLICKYS